MSSYTVRLAGCAVLLATLGYAPWMLASLNTNALWLALPFAAVNILLIVALAVALVNNWRHVTPPLRLAPEGEEPLVAVIIPTCGEPPAMVARTARSVLLQRWPERQLRLIISDDGHSSAIKGVAELLQREFRSSLIIYHEPPLPGSSKRNGAAKAGNLNSALEIITRYWGQVEFIETRDADDEVGDVDFLRHCLGQLQADERLAYAQTIKEARVSEGDPFANLNGMFYRGSMLARNATNTVFPCGSGLVWRKSALLDIGGFPVWNLVEDLQSGVEALRRGWRGIYIPIVGAIGQTAPEDIPNVYKQISAWAIDTMRLFFWGNVSGLNWRQRLSFIELGLFYAQSVTVITILLTLTVSVATQIYPLTTTQLSYALHFWPFALSIELFLAALNGTQRFEALMRQREMWIGLAPIILGACVAALLGGPHRKPAYRVTRKTHQFGWYWRETLPQALLLALLTGGIVYGLLTSSLLRVFDLGSAYWAVFYGVFLIGFLRKSWFGVGRRSREWRDWGNQETGAHSRISESAHAAEH